MNPAVEREFALADMNRECAGARLGDGVGNSERVVHRLARA
jgi:hypothetical protein